MLLLQYHIKYPSRHSVTVELSCDKNIQIAETSIKLLAGILSSLSGNLTQINPNTLQKIMQGMHYLINGKRNTTKTSALDVCLFIFNNIGAENYLQLMSYSLKESVVLAMGQAMARGIDLSCGCFGAETQAPVSIWSILRNLALIAACLLVVVKGAGWRLPLGASPKELRSPGSEP